MFGIFLGGLLDIIYIYTRRCPKMGGPQNGGFIIIMDNPIKMDDLGVPRF